MYLRFTPNLLQFLSNLDGLYALCPTPNFYEIHPNLRSLNQNKSLEGQIIEIYQNLLVLKLHHGRLVPNKANQKYLLLCLSRFLGTFPEHSHLLNR
jgi:hypothetical protein